MFMKRACLGLLLVAVPWIGASGQTYTIKEASNRSVPNTPVTLSFFGAPGDYYGQNIHPVVNGVSKEAQVDVESTWKDGSICHALITFLMDVQAKATYQVTFLPTAKTPRTGGKFKMNVPRLLGPLSVTADFVEKNGQQSTFDFDATDAFLLARNASWNGPFARFGAFGPLLREYEWRFRPRSGSVDHSDLEVLLRWRLYHDQPTAFVEVIVENCRTDVKPHDLEIARATVTVGGKKLIDLIDVNHLVQTRYMCDTWVGVSPPELRIRPDLVYLAETGLVPPLDPKNAVTESQAVAYINRMMGNSQRGLVDTTLSLGVPNNHGPIYKYQPGTGDRQDIGWLPGWAMMALNGFSQSAERITCAGDGNGSASFPIHNRDMAHGEMGIDHGHSYWSKNIRHQPKFKNPRIPNTAHMALLGYTGFVLTGRKTFLEEMNSWTLYAMRDWYPNVGYPKGMGDRKGAWALRNMVLSATVNPDDHPLKQYFRQKVDSAASNWTSNIDFSLPLGSFGTGGWKASGRSSWPVGMRTSPWMEAWFSGMCWMAWKLQGNQELYDLFAYNWQFYQKGYLTTDTWTAPNGELVSADPRLLMQYSKLVSIYTPTVTNNSWAVLPNSVVSLANFAESQWYERICEDFPVKSASNPAWPAAGPEPMYWRPNGGSYRPPTAQNYDEYGPGRVGLIWMAMKEGLPQATQVANVVEPWIRNQRKGKASATAPGIEIPVKYIAP